MTNLAIDKEEKINSFKRHSIKLPNECGIYKITSIKHKTFYIGSSKNINKRRKEHFSELRRNSHCNSILQRIYNKYGENNFLIEVLELCPEEDQFIKEQYYIDILKPKLNICKIVEKNFWSGKHHTEETKEKISKANKGKKISDEHKKIISQSNKTRIVSDETRYKRSESLKGHIFTEDSKQKSRESQGIKIVQLDCNMKLIKI